MDRGYDAGDYIRLSYQIDERVETDVLCFAYEDHGDGLDEPFGLDANCDGTADSNNGANRLVPALTEYRSLIPETGTTLTLRIKVHVDGSKEEIAFDDIVVGSLSSRLEPSEQPTAFTAVASSGASTHLSWTDVAGTHLPTGYVIYAGTSNTLSTPTDGIPPEIDTDLSDGNAVVNVYRGTISRYTFTGLAVSTTYYFQIWAFSNTGNDIDYLISTAGPTASVTVQNLIFHEGFETDGHILGRYTASSNGGFLAHNGAYFQRTDGTDISNSSDAYTGFLGDYFWAAEWTGHVAGDGNAEQTIEFEPINIAGSNNLSISGFFGAQSIGFDEGDYIRLSYQIDEGAETDVLCFGVEDRNGDTTDESFGLDADCDGIADNNGVNRLGSTLTEYSANIPETGDLLTVRIRVRADGTGEEIAFDDIKVAGTPPASIQEITGGAGWRFLSLPKTGGTVSDIADDTAIQGIKGGLNPNTEPNMIIYDASGAWTTPLDVDTPWGDGYGFALYFYDNTVAGSTALPITLDATGTEPSTDVTVALNATKLVSSSYFTLAGNPFASNFDASTITQTGDAIQNNIHLWNNEVKSYSAQDRTTPYIVSPWQGFWVEVSDNSSTSAISFPISGTTDSAQDRTIPDIIVPWQVFPVEATKGNANPTTAITSQTKGKASTDVTGTPVSKKAANRGDINFTLSSETTYDEAIRLSFRETATLDYDLEDASKLTPLLSEYATMSFKSNGMLKSVESLPWDLTQAVTIPMEENAVGVSGGVTLSWKGLESIPADWRLTFHDYDTGINVDMRSVLEYTFEEASSAKAKVNPLSILTGPVAVVQKSKGDYTRFAITITPFYESIQEEDKVYEFALEQNYPNPFNPSTTINYSVANNSRVSLIVYNILGQKAAELVNEIKTAGSYNVTWNAASAASGLYYYRLETEGQTLIRKMMLIK